MEVILDEKQKEIKAEIGVISISLERSDISYLEKKINQEVHELYRKILIGTIEALMRFA